MVFAMAKSRRIGHDHQAPSFLFFLLLDFKCDTRRKQAATRLICFGPLRFLQILSPYSFIAAHWNINSILKEGRIDELIQYVRTLHAQVFIFTES